MVGQDQPVLLGGGADHGHPEGRPSSQIAHRGAFGCANLPEMLIDAGFAVPGGEVGVPPPRRRIGRDDLNRLPEPFEEASRQVGMPVDRGLYRFAQAVRVERAGHGDV
ncbi:hypothetical protein MTY59_22290 [Mycobacterium senriense]|uniref:Uncharacterized protein n=1 Tax=Mycobacterium senriense TaxID=2775496 RepID=A0ABM7SQL4_9MYCO|nr:hypothetical protein MTY59_22290 [Mycobacterium senriense]